MPDIANLHDLLVARRDDLPRRVGERLQTVVASAGMPRRELVNSLPLLLGELIDALADGARNPRPPTPAVRSLGTSHGEQRLRIGFGVEALVQDYHLLRSCVFELIDEAGLAVTLWEMRTVSEVIDAATFEAVREFQRQRDAQHGRQAREHLGFLAHELRNPLSSARAAFEVLRKTVLTGGGKPSAVLDRNLTRVGDLIDQTLVRHRVQAGVTPARERVRVRALLENAAEESAIDASTRGLRVVVDAEDVEFDADPRLLRSVVTNLVRNAVKFSHEGGTIVVRARAAERRLRLEVEDSCGGLEPATMTRLFDPFVQTHADRSGFGLGLAIARQAVEAHGGQLQVHNLEGQGCVFRVDLPLALEAAG